MKLAAFSLLSLGAAKAPKLKSVELPDFEFMSFDFESGERHQEVQNLIYGHYKHPSKAEMELYGGCLKPGADTPSRAGVPDGEQTESSGWHCMFVNRKRKNNDKPRPLICLASCIGWKKDGFDTGCRLHAQLTNKSNGFAYCDAGKWRVTHNLKECFCDLCDPKDAQAQLEAQQRAGRLENYHANFEKYKNYQFGKEDFISYTHSQAITGTCDPGCKYQKTAYQHGKLQGVQPILTALDPPTAYCDRKKGVWNFKDHCDCLHTCSTAIPVPGANNIRYAAGLPAPEIRYIHPWFADNNSEFGKDSAIRAYVHCGTDTEIKNVCGEKGLKEREKNHWFCGKGQWLRGPESPVTCECATGKGDSSKKSKDKHNNNKKKDKHSSKPHDGHSSHEIDNPGRPNKPYKANKKGSKKNKKNKH